ncbi:matrix metalloproteinase-25 [Lepeophtheirus salmonis]|uniref:matrix metalloproteinase-25 n=1 Tax=Lepeophtheirus salmonis TaxID=72036 RepID=UPI001AE283E0|nr:matrix metalloproteinase-2-like [Lepeophtheirus salmonis]
MCKIVFLIVLVLWSLSFSIGIPIPQEAQTTVPPSSSIDLFDFFRNYGYLSTPPPDSETLYTEESISNALLKVQEFGAIEQTGKFDEATRKLLTTPRCGNPDLINGESVGVKKRRKRYIIGSEGWKTRRITYKLDNWSNKFPNKSYVEEKLKKAFDTWSDYSGLVFVQVGELSPANIKISFGRYNHGDIYPFDGPGYTLAHAYYPYSFGSLGGDIHFDEDENWGTEKKHLDLLTVAVHEMGHALGLSHSIDRDSVMFAYYKGDSAALGYDDILAMYNLYIQNGPPQTDDEDSFGQETHVTKGKVATSPRVAVTSTSATMTTTTEDSYNYDGSENPRNEICNGEFQSISVIRREIFIFKGQNVWRYRKPGELVNGFPVPLSRMFPGVPPQIKHIDAAYEKLNGSIIFFSDNRFYKYDGRSWTDEPKNNLASIGLPKDTPNIDSIFIWSKNKETYVFKGDHFWRMNSNGTAELDYPKRISDYWNGLPSSIDSIITLDNGQTFAFKDGYFYLFNNESLNIESGYPRELGASYWLPHCTLSK